MKYKNIETGAVFDSPFVIKGKNWKLVEEKKSEKPVTKKVTSKTKR